MSQLSCSIGEPPTGWPTSRILFLVAGTVTLASTLLATTVSPWFLVLTTAVGMNQLVLVATGTCPASLIIDRLKARHARRTTQHDVSPHHPSHDLERT
jgi:hypothetical protein